MLILWIIGLFAQLPLIPWIETDYFVSNTKDTLANGMLLKQSNSVIVKLELPNYFPESNQCFDVWFSSTSGHHILTVNDFSLKAFNSNNSELNKGNSYLFWDNGSNDEQFKIENYGIAKSDTTGKEKYVFFRTTFDVGNINSFLISIKTNYSVDSKMYSLDQKIFVKKKHRLTWNKFRVH